MSSESSIRRRALRGMMRRRLLVNALVDPAEAAPLLPAGVRPHVVDGHTLVGCCLLDIEQLRPAAMPAGVGVGLRATAHRISAEWDTDDGPIVGVYVPRRYTDSRAARAIGGRWFPGVQRPAAIEVVESEGWLRWSVAPRDHATGFGIRIQASTASGGVAPSLACEPVGGTCLGATIGLSLDHHGGLEAARMEPEHRRAQRVEAVVDSEFLARFASAEPAAAYLMRDVEVTWCHEPLPPLLQAGVPA